MSVHVHIERLVLDGLPPSDREGAVVAASVATELSRLLVESEIELHSQVPIAVPSVAGGVVRLAPGVSPVAVGRQIAGAVRTGMTP